MRRSIVTIATLLALAGGVQSAQEELDTDWMHAIEDANKSLASNIATKQASEASSDAKELADWFAKVQAYYQTKGDAPDAVELARKSGGLTQQIRQSIDAKDFDAATASATALSRTCKTCHNFYKKS
ncbi:MAG TPA: hypothetical protein VF169_22940 [Albitalea sp.]|uniref:hypothetical protein n=1 Tax=Piscinibacter sp. TaxID=1903157 RepID=UPI002ED21114